MEKVFDTMENILISAYGCEPDKGSEPGAGWNWAVEVAKRHKVTVLTRANNRCSIEKELQVNPRPNMSFIYYDLPESIKKYKKGQKWCPALLRAMANRRIPVCKKIEPTA